MKKINLLFLILLSAIIIQAQQEKIVDSKITQATVYQKGVVISRDAEINLPKGKTTLLFNGLSAKLSPSSIQAKGDNKLMIVSVSHQIDYMNQAETDQKIRALNNRKLFIKDSLELIKGLKQVYQHEKEMVLSNKNLGGDNGVNVSELEQAAIFFRKRLTEIEHKTKQLENEKYKLNLELVNVAKQLMELNFKAEKPTSRVKVVVSAEIAGKYALALNYIISDAGWTPVYDIRINDVNEKMRLSYKAQVFQNTDENWKNVKLILSTGNPAISNNKPELDTYYLTFNNYYTKQKQTVDDWGYEPYNGIVRGKVTETETGEALPGTSIYVKGTTIGTVSDINGEYELKNIGSNGTLVFSFVGFDSAERNISSGVINVELSPSVLALEEVVVTAYGARSKSQRSKQSVGNTTKIDEQIPLSIEKRETSTEFEIDIPYSIASDNQQYDVNMVEYDIPAQYHYSSVPKLSEDAYLTAKIPNWTDYEMISGSAHIFFQGVYQGKTFLDLKSFEDTLNISVGRDKDIAISREIQKDYSRKNTIGLNVTETKSWLITIKNNKNSAIELVVEDQFPISKENDIKVSQIEFAGATLNEDDGKLIWNLKLQAKEKKELLIKYEVKYPKNRNLIVD